METGISKQLFFVLIAFHSFILFGQPSSENDLWICSHKVSTYESDGKQHCDTTQYFSSVLWFESSEMHFVSVTNDLENNSIKTDTFETRYTVNDNGLISGQLDGFPMSGIKNDSILILFFGGNNNHVELTFFNTSAKDYKLDSMNEAKITEIITGKKWSANIRGQETIMEFDHDNKYISSGWSGALIWELRRIHGYYFITISTLLTEPGLLLIKQIDQSAILVDLFANGTISSVQMTMKEN